MSIQVEKTETYAQKREQRIVARLEREANRSPEEKALETLSLKKGFIILRSPFRIVIAEEDVPDAEAFLTNINMKDKIHIQIGLFWTH